MEEPIPEPRLDLVRRRALRHWIFQQSAVCKKQVHAAVVIVIKNRHTSAHRLEQILLRRRRSLMLEIDFRLRADVGKDDRRMRLWTRRWRDRKSTRLNFSHGY